MRHPEILVEVSLKWAEYLEMMTQTESQDMIIDLLCTEIHKERELSRFYKKMWERSMNGVSK